MDSSRRAPNPKQEFNPSLFSPERAPHPFSPATDASEFADSDLISIYDRLAAHPQSPAPAPHAAPQVPLTPFTTATALLSLRASASMTPGQFLDPASFAPSPESQTPIRVGASHSAAPGAPAKPRLHHDSDADAPSSDSDEHSSGSGYDSDAEPLNLQSVYTPKTRDQRALRIFNRNIEEEDVDMTVAKSNGHETAQPMQTYPDPTNFADIGRTSVVASLKF